MITIRNLQRKFCIDKQKIEQSLEIMLKKIRYEQFDIGLLFVSEKKMQEYNNQYRQKDSVTDILSFPYHHEIKAGERIVPVYEDDANLGDIIICPARVAHDAVTLWKRNLDEHLVTLLAHGIAHLLNYDHQTDDDYAQMQKIEQLLLRAVKNNERNNDASTKKK